MLILEDTKSDVVVFLVIKNILNDKILFLFFKGGIYPIKSANKSLSIIFKFFCVYV